MPNNIVLQSHIVGFSPTNHTKESKKMDFQESNDSGGGAGELSYMPLHKLANICLSNDYSVLYGAESAPDEAAKERIFGGIENTSKSKLVHDKISNGSLTIVDIDSIHEQCGVNYDSLVEFWNSSVKLADERPQISKGTIMFSAPDSYFKNNQHGTFFMFEATMGKTFSMSKSMICWYRDKWLKDLSLTSLIKILIKILTTHKHTIHDGFSYKEWTGNEIINTIHQGIDKILGPDSAILLFRSMNAKHRLNQGDILTRPAVVEGLLKQMLDDESSNAVINSIFDQFVSKVSSVQDVSSDG
jgi:hypothetical protein